MNNKQATSFSEMSFIKLKDEHWLARQKIAGKCVAACLSASKKLIESETKNLSLKDIEAACSSIISSMDCTSTFLGYKGFSGVICTSVNKQLVHGIPTDYLLQQGDVVKVDLGATYKGAIADAAITVIYGKPKSQQHVDLINTCNESLNNAIKSIQVGKRLGSIGNAINYIVKKTRYSLVTHYGGHGIDENKPHAEPFVANKSIADSGIRIQPGMTLAIEPMLLIGGDTKTWVGSDGWTVNALDVSSHFEHSIYIAEDKVHILTQMD